MSCFNHHDRHSVALCRLCNKQMCPDCIFESQYDFVFSEKCAAEVELIQNILERNERDRALEIISDKIHMDTLLKLRRQYLNQIAIWVLGLSMVVVQVGSNGGKSYALTFGVIFIILIFYAWYRARIMKSAADLLCDRIKSYDQRDAGQ